MNYLSNTDLRAAVEEIFVWLENHRSQLEILRKVPSWVYVLIPTAFVTYKYFTWHFGTFKKLGIKGPKPVPVFGTMWSLLKKGTAEEDMNLRKYGTVVGTFLGRTPNMLVYDPEMLKQILVKDFSNFTNRVGRPQRQYPIDLMLTKLTGEDWKRVRTILTPTFSGGKLRKIDDRIHECCNTLLSNLMKKAETGEIFDFKEFCGAFTMDVIASAAFGIKIDSHNDPNNEFLNISKQVFNRAVSIVVFFVFLFPFLVRPIEMLGFKLFPQNVIDFFSNVIDSAMEQRKSGSEQKNADFIQLMIDAGSEELGAGAENERSKAKLSRGEILANGLIFFLAGYESVANTLALLGYLLAINPECQEKCIEEVDQLMKDSDRVDYDLVKKMPYLEMCMNETLRLYPPALRVDREAMDDITINGILIPKGMAVTVPIYAIHRDPELWPEPEKFIPERFSSEQKSSHSPYAYLPFGGGPRSCIAMRLAQVEVKAAMATLLSKFRFEITSETKNPLRMKKHTNQSLNGIKLRVVERQKRSVSQ